MDSPQAFCSISEACLGMPYPTVQNLKSWFLCTCCVAR